MFDANATAETAFAESRPQPQRDTLREQTPYQKLWLSMAAQPNIRMSTRHQLLKESKKLI